MTWQQATQVQFGGLTSVFVIKPHSAVITHGTLLIQLMSAHSKG